MLELSYKTINAPGFDQAIGKLYKYTGFHPAQRRNIANIVEGYHAEIKKARKLSADVLKRFAELDEKGNTIKTDEEPFFKLKEGVTIEDLNKEFDEVLKLKFSIPTAMKIPEEVLGEKVGLSPQDCFFLQELVSPIEEVVD